MQPTTQDTTTQTATSGMDQVTPMQTAEITGKAVLSITSGARLGQSMRRRRTTPRRAVVHGPVASAWRTVCGPRGVRTRHRDGRS
jgi:hypothetical protein